jgi:hypothetical protein
VVQLCDEEPPVPELLEEPLTPVAAVVDVVELSMESIVSSVPSTTSDVLARCSTTLVVERVVVLRAVLLDLGTLTDVDVASAAEAVTVVVVRRVVVELVVLMVPGVVSLVLDEPPLQPAIAATHRAAAAMRSIPLAAMRSILPPGVSGGI